jgi:hypothetical protein
MKLVRAGTLAALMALALIVSATPAQAALIELHKSTRDVGGVHVAVVLYKSTNTGQITGYCSLSGNSGVVKHIRYCVIKRGNPTANYTYPGGAPDGPLTINVESHTPFVTPIAGCSWNYAAYIGYAFNHGTTTVGRTLFVNPC